MTVEVVAAAIALLAISFSVFHIFWSTYRMKVPHPRALLEKNLEVRESLTKDTAYYLDKSRVPSYELPFLLWDLLDLRRIEKCKLVEEIDHIGKYGHVVSKKDVDRYKACVRITCGETPGHLRRAQVITQGSAPYVYARKTFRLEQVKEESTCDESSA